MFVDFKHSTDFTTSVTASKHKSAVDEVSFLSRSSVLPLIRAFVPKQTTANADLVSDLLSADLLECRLT